MEQACEVGRGLLIEVFFFSVFFNKGDDVELYLLCNEGPVQVEGDNLVEVYCGV